MEPEPSEHGLKLTFRQFLQALRTRGRTVEADRYEHDFLEIHCPPLSRDHVLDLSFSDLCKATSLLRQKLSISNFNGQTREGSNFRYGTYYLKKMGRWPQSQT